MPEFVRVSDKETRHHYSITRERYERTPELWDLLKQDATAPEGSPLPPKYRTTVASAAGKQAATPANTEKENG